MKKYSSLFANLSVPAWGLTAPANPGDLYVVYYPSSSTQNRSITCDGANVSMNVSIFSQNHITGKVNRINDVAGEIFSLLMPESSEIQLTTMQNVQTNLTADGTNIISIGAVQHVQRNLIFTHNIYFN